MRAPLLLSALLRWTLLAAAAGILGGTASAALLASLDWATATRETHPWLLFLLPAAGLASGWVYQTFGRSVEGGNNLLLEEIHNPRQRIPLRMTPLVLFGTTVSHLFGGSAGREGTALQTGGSLVDQLSGPLGLRRAERRILLMAGVSAGFGSVFGTPLAGAVFGLEVLAIGRFRHDALFPCLLAALIGDRVTLLWGLHHTHYVVPFTPPLSLSGGAAALLAGACFGLTARLFALLTHRVSAFVRARIAYGPLRPAAGGAVVALSFWALGTMRYAGLGIPTIVESFTGAVPPWDFAAKLLFTALTVGSGFKGGEVTPLFFMGATEGNALAHLLPLPAALLAGMGFVSIFGGAANTPLAAILLAIELFGAAPGPYCAIAAVASYLFSGHAGIYSAQRLGHAKHADLVRAPLP